MREYLLNLLDQGKSLSVEEICVYIAMAAVLGLVIYLSYWITHAGTIYSRKFNVSLIMLTVLTCTVMLVIGNNVALSLGMVGALSIVRFRAAIKDPLDIVYLFWALACGIVTGAGQFLMAIIGSIVVGVVLLIFVNRKENDHPYLLVVSCEDDRAEHVAFAALSHQKFVIKSKTVTADGVEVTAEVRLPDDGTTSFVNQVAASEGVRSAVLVSYNGEYLS